jgi:geranylgeranyl pyrophosphate synthase
MTAQPQLIQPIREIEGIKAVPEDGRVRADIRELARDLAGGLDPSSVPLREDLERAAQGLLTRLGLPRGFLGFTMVAIDNAFWADAFAAVPAHRRLLLLPKCLSNEDACQGSRDSIGLQCAECGGCELVGLKRQAESLGYQVIIAEGTSSVVMKVLEGEADAILGVACLDSLEKSFERIADLGIPHQAIPLLTDGCRDTTAELDLIRDAMAVIQPLAPSPARRTYIPLLRETQTIFRPDQLDAILDDCACPAPGKPEPFGSLTATDAIARDWLKQGGKRLRPFTTVAAYAVGKHGLAALAPDADVAALVPTAVRKIAIAIEALHKASLVHDDIEDRDPFRYGKPTLHRTHGIDVAINVGDYLVGIGYNLIASQVVELGAACVADTLKRLSDAHLQLCCGQGTELLWNRQSGDGLRPVHALQIGALKTAPAFEVAIYAGLRAAGAAIDTEKLRQFATYVGEGYQVLNDLNDWEEGGENKVSLGQDALAERPGILRAFVLEAGGGERLAAIREQVAQGGAPEAAVASLRDLYAQTGAFAKAEALYERLQGRAIALCDGFGNEALQGLMRFLARNILYQRKRAVGEGRG